MIHARDPCMQYFWGADSASFSSETRVDEKGPLHDALVTFTLSIGCLHCLQCPHH